MNIPETSISFSCDDPLLLRLYEEAEAKCLLNLRHFGKDLVLVEGGGYDKIWLETQPMGGEMYALRNPEAGLNNSLLFMRCQREDGRLPGSIRFDGERLIPEYNKYQGFCFPWHALNLYFLFDRDPEYLSLLRDVLTRFDACLWRTRALRPDGLLRSFCVYDTGEDLALRYGDAPCWWTEDEPPEGCQVVPMASMDVTSWSFACRDTLARICDIQGDPEAAPWREKAREVALALRRELWNERRGALFDLDREGNLLPTLCHNTLRCMYWGSVSREMAARFVREHLLNPAEFWTPFPLPSVAVNDPLFRNAPENNWSGQPEGLTWQRAILALENYGFDALVPRLGRILFDAIIRGGFRFTQQYDPFTGAPSLVHAMTHQPVIPGGGEPVQDAYGPTLLAVLEYFAHCWGIRPHLGSVRFSAVSGLAFETNACFLNHRYAVRSTGSRFEVSVDGKTIHTGPTGFRLSTTTEGTILEKVPIDP